MTSPTTQRRRDPAPLSQGWEIPFLVIGAIVILIPLIAVAGVAVAAALFGGGWVWPHGTDMITHVLGGILQGEPGRGLPPDQRSLVATKGVSYLSIAVCELIAVLVGIALTVLIVRYRNTGDGMATRHEAEQALGVSQLRKARWIIRPDLYQRRTVRQRAMAALIFARAKITREDPVRR